MRNLWLLLSILFISSCSEQRNDNFYPETETHKILELHHSQRTFHFEKNAEAFVNLFSDNFVSVNKGKVIAPTVSENRSKFQTYFNNVEFKKWDDIEPPIIRFSDDGSMAYTIVKKEIIIQYLNDKKETTEEKTVFAWTTIYRKQNGEWKIECVTSTNQVEEKRLVEIGK